jgi:hypothetical protein
MAAAEDTPKVGAVDDEDDGKMVDLVSQEGDNFQVEKKVAKMSELVKTMIPGAWGAPARRGEGDLRVFRGGEEQLVKQEKQVEQNRKDVYPCFDFSSALARRFVEAKPHKYATASARPRRDFQHADTTNRVCLRARGYLSLSRVHASWRIAEGVSLRERAPYFCRFLESTHG